MTPQASSILKILLLALTLVILYFSKTVVIAALIGIGFGVLVSPVLDHLQKWLKIRRAYGALIFIVAMIIFLATVLGLFGWIIVDQINALIAGMPEFTNRLRSELSSVFDRFPWMLEHIQSFDFAGAIQTAANYSMRGLQASATAIGGVVFALIIGIYLAIDRTFYFEGLVRVFPPEKRGKAKDTLVKCAHVVRVWFRAQLIDMVIIGLITTVGLWIVGVKYWALFGLLTALLGIIPYVGVMIVVVIVSLITLATDPSQVLWVFLVFFITQQIEGNIVLPMVMKGQAEIPEALLIVIMLFFGFWFGLLGVFIAPPLVAVMICLYRTLYLPWIESPR